MASANSSNSNKTKTRWEGYSNYQEVSKRVSQSVSDALDAYTLLYGARTEGAAISPELAANSKADILSAAIRLLVEMEEEQNSGVDDYDEILERWGGEQGFIREFHDARIVDNGLPGWMFQFILDIRKAGWSLGYLQAGRRSKQDPDDPVEAEVENMFEGM